MNRTAVMMPSSTHAFSAKRMLEGDGIYCEIKRTVRPSRNGCSYYILAQTDKETVGRLLKKYGIRFGDAVDMTEETEK